jgi:hypothetical protein
MDKLDTVMRLRVPGILHQHCHRQAREECRELGAMVIHLIARGLFLSAYQPWFFLTSDFHGPEVPFPGNFSEHVRRAVNNGEHRHGKKVQ